REMIATETKNTQIVKPSIFDLAVGKNKQSSPKDSTDPKNTLLPALDGRGRGRMDNDRSTQVHQYIAFKEISRLKEDISIDYPEEKNALIEEFFWMIEEYKVSLFAQELKTPYPVSPKKLNQLIEEIEKL
ncbi:MAG: DUF3418 domain-containing protein, partial [Smithella sp.]|nr:DUF3418 domain-containing protein [Smithella sp.]